ACDRIDAGNVDCPEPAELFGDRHRHLVLGKDEGYRTVDALECLQPLGEVGLLFAATEQGSALRLEQRDLFEERKESPFGEVSRIGRVDSVATVHPRLPEGLGAPRPEV